jgi:iron-sulfur cluster insertion protein
MKQIITISKKAGIQLAKIASHSKNNSILFYVKGGGCNGFNYKLKPLNDEPNKLDEVINYNKINIIIDKSSIIHLIGTNIDWKTDIMGEYFHFENPNALTKCGCGTSFSI